MSAKEDAEDRSRDDTRQLEILLVYEDRPTALRAKCALDRALSQPDATLDSQFHAWRLDVLAEPACQQQATQDARGADIIVLTAHGNNRMSAEAEASLNRWVAAKRAKPCALVISLDGDARPAAERDSALTELRSAAARHGVTVLLHFGEPPRSEMNAAIADIRRRADTTSQVLEGILHRPELPQHWGINE